MSEGINDKLDEILSQVRETNGRVTSLEARASRTEGHVKTLRHTVFGSETEGLDNDGGLVGLARTTRRDVRIVGATVVLVMPWLLWVLDRIVLA